MYIFDIGLGSKIAFSIFNIPVYWYGLAYLFGMLIAIFLGRKLNQKYKIFFNENILSYKKSNEIFEKFFFILILSLIFGGRLGYVLFYNFQYYIKNPLEIFMPWKGGMAFHGAFLAMIFSSYLFSQKYKINFLKLSDFLCFISGPGIFLGRIGNFINHELIGDLVGKNAIFGITVYKYDSNYSIIPTIRHPSQIYEAIFEGLMPFFITLIINKKFKLLEIKKKQGYISIFFLLFYGISRFIIEMFFRMPDEQLGHPLFNKFTIGQFFCFTMVIIALFITAYIYYKNSSKKYDSNL